MYASKLGIWESHNSIDVNKRTESIVAIANGAPKAEPRKRIVDVFTSPFQPNVLVTSSVMAEGFDLSRRCRHVIHHDLGWSTSTLEQRPGPVDQLESKALLIGQTSAICGPSVADAQGYKEFCLIKHRERWFGHLMGGRVPQDEVLMDLIANRSRLPEALSKQLMPNILISHTAKGA